MRSIVQSLEQVLSAGLFRAHILFHSRVHPEDTTKCLGRQGELRPVTTTLGVSRKRILSILADSPRWILKAYLSYAVELLNDRPKPTTKPVMVSKTGLMPTIMPCQ